MSKFSISLSDRRGRSAKEVIEGIIALAKEKGIDQVTLANRAGISPESLSRLKKAGGCRLGTALDLACAAGFERLVLAEQPSAKVATSIAARKLSAGRRVPIDSEDLVLALRSDVPQAEYRVHLCGFFEELPIELVHDVILDQTLDYAHLIWLANELRVEGETLDWLKDMAGDGLAEAA